MFAECRSLSVDVSKWNTNNVVEFEKFNDLTLNVIAPAFKA